MKSWINVLRIGERISFNEMIQDVDNETLVYV